MDELLNKNIDELKLGEKADFLKSLKDQKGEFNAEIKKLNRKIEEVEWNIRQSLNDLGTDIVRGQTVTVSLSVSEKPTVEDWDSFYDYIITQQAPYLLERKPSVKPIREIWGAGQEIDGLTKTEVVTVNTRTKT